jgi:DDE domain
LHPRRPRRSSDTAGMRTRRPPRPASVVRSAFAGFHFPGDVIVLAVRWYLRFGLCYRDVEELRTDHVTIYRWVQRFTPLLADAARPCRHAVGDRWQVDETYVKVAGRWRYMYRAIDQFGQVSTYSSHHGGMQAPPGGSSSGPLARPRSPPPRSQPNRRGCIQRCWRSCCQRVGCGNSDLAAELLVRSILAQ